MKKPKLSAAGISISKAIFLGIGISILLLIVMAIIAAALISNEYFDINASKYIVGVSAFIAIFIGGLTAGKLVKERTVVTCVAVVGGCLFVQLTVGILLFDGISSSFMLNLLPILAGSGSAILLCMRNKSHTVSKKKRVRPR